MKKYFWIGLYLSFVIFAVIVKRYVEDCGLEELWGWDYKAFVEQIRDWGYVTYFGFRHPGLGMILSPLVVIEHFLPMAYLAVFPGVAVGTAYLIFKMSGWVGLLVWLCFPTTWWMAAIPESFPLAQLALVGSFYWFLNNRTLEDKKDSKQLYWAFGFAVLNGIVTLSNGLKPALAYLATCRDRKRMWKILSGVAVATVAGVIFYYVRSVITGRDISKNIAITLMWIPESRDLLKELYGFFVRPVGFYQSLIVYPIFIWGLTKLRRSVDKILILSLISYFAVDFMIHFIIGWGMVEPWLFAPHWLFMVPVIIGRVYQMRTCQVDEVSPQFDRH